MCKVCELGSYYYIKFYFNVLIHTCVVHADEISQENNAIEGEKEELDDEYVKVYTTE